MAFGFGTKAKAKPKIWPGLAFGLAWQYLGPTPGQKAKASTACFEGHWWRPEMDVCPCLFRGVRQGGYGGTGIVSQMMHQTITSLMS
jgi:hypothetical protein